MCVSSFLTINRNTYFLFTLFQPLFLRTALPMTILCSFSSAPTAQAVTTATAATILAGITTLSWPAWASCRLQANSSIKVSSSCVEAQLLCRQLRQLSSCLAPMWTWSNRQPASRQSHWTGWTWPRTCGTATAVAATTTAAATAAVVALPSSWKL